MRIALFNTTGFYALDGSALVSAILKQAGHQVTRIGLLPFWRLSGHPGARGALDGILRDVDLVMMSVYSDSLAATVEVRELVRKARPDLEVVWGGPHCISAPEQALRYADAVCYAEGDLVAAEIAARFGEGADWLLTPNMALLQDGVVVRSRLLPPLENLDMLPFPDMGLEGQFVLGDELLPLTKELRAARSFGWPINRPSLHLTTGRGCPHRCSYCNNVRFLALHGHHRLRWHSVDYVLRMLEATRATHEFVESFFLADDDFFARSRRDLEAFASGYRERIALPFGVAMSPSTFDEAKLDALLAAGLEFIQMGIQSGSQRVCTEVFDRRIEVGRARDVVRRLARPRPGGRALSYLFLDIITDNPYETPDDAAQSYGFLLDIHRELLATGPTRTVVNLFFLAFSPGTPLFERALKDGTLAEEDLLGPAGDFVRDAPLFERSYELFLLALVAFLNVTGKLRLVPLFVLRLLATRPVRRLASLLPGTLYARLATRLRLLLAWT